MTVFINQGGRETRRRPAVHLGILLAVSALWSVIVLGTDAMRDQPGWAVIAIGAIVGYLSQVAARHVRRVQNIHDATVGDRS